MQPSYESDFNIYAQTEACKIDVNESSSNQLPTWNGRQVSVKSKCLEKTVVGAICCFGVSAIASAVTGLCLKIQKDTDCLENDNCDSGPTTPIKVMAGLTIGFLGLISVGAIYLTYKQDRQTKQLKQISDSEVQMTEPS